MASDFINIALADDDEDDRLFFVEALDELKLKTKITTYTNGCELMNCLNGATSNFPDILFLDLNMPRKSGFECLREIKSNPKFKNIVIAIYSTSGSHDDIDKTFMDGANIYIRKPSSFEMLKQILSSTVSINWQYQTNALNRDNFLLRL